MMPNPMRPSLFHSPLSLTAPTVRITHIFVLLIETLYVSRITTAEIYSLIALRPAHRAPPNNRAKSFCRESSTNRAAPTDAASPSPSSKPKPTLHAARRSRRHRLILSLIRSIGGHHLSAARARARVSQLHRTEQPPEAR
jgi:hypothetical protein